MMLQRCAHSRHGPTATDEKTTSLLYVLVVISLIRTISGKIFKTVAFFVSPIRDHYILPTAAFLSFFGTDSTDSPRTVYRFLLYSFCVFFQLLVVVSAR